MTFASFGFAVLAMFILFPVINSVNRQKAFSHIESEFNELFDREDSFTEAQWETRITAFSVAVSKYTGNSRRRDVSNVEQVKRWHSILSGFDPDKILSYDPETGEPIYEFVGDTEQDVRNKELIATAKTEIIDLLNIVFAPPIGNRDASLSMTLKNHSDWIISEVRMAFDVFDSEGNPSNGSVRNDNRWHVRTSDTIRPGETDQPLFLTRWEDRDVASVKLIWMEVEFGPNRVDYFPYEVCSVLWP
jgi:hypothetical protein